MIVSTPGVAGWEVEEGEEKLARKAIRSEQNS